MAEDADTAGPSAPASLTAVDTTAERGDDKDAQYKQAIRFLVSLQSQRNQDEEAQRAFLLSKGLDAATIDRAMSEARRPQGTDGLLNNTTEQTARTVTAGLPDSEAFDAAARAFDDPLHADDLASTHTSAPSLPPKTYPRSPLALYQQGQQVTQSSIDNPLTRYHVLLRFFRSMSYFLMLGGGIAAVFVGIYWSYMMPRIVATLDARSQLLKHHRDLYIMLANKINDVRHNGLSTLAAGKENEASASRRSSLKKVQFADEVSDAGTAKTGETKEPTSDDEEKKQSGESKAPIKTAQSTEKTPLLSDVHGSDGAIHAEVETAEAVESTLQPIDIMQPLRASLVRLRDTLRADTSSAAIGTAFAASSKAVSHAVPTSATVQDESDAESWLSESDSDELEFDPYAAASKKLRSGAASPRRKHTPKTGGTASRERTTDKAAHKTASESSATALKSTLGSMHAYINSQTFRARTGGGTGYGGASSFGNGAAFGSLSGSAATEDGGKQSAAVSRQGDVSQIRADIRSLKGLLLSRRNFPIYSRPVNGNSARIGTSG